MRRALDKLIWVVLIVIVSGVIYTMSGRSDDGESQELPWFSWAQPQTVHAGGGNTPPPSGPSLLEVNDESGVRFAAP
jgi:hypothetical protein